MTDGHPDGHPIAVVGGGIAGAAACLRLAALGLPPLWIAPPAPAGDRPGEQLSPAARPLLARLGAADLLDAPGHRPANALFSAWGSELLAERNAAVHLEGPPVVLDRPAFEAALSARAEAACARRLAAPLEQAERRDDGWRLAAAGGAGSARFLLDASGRAAAVASRRASRFRADRLAALCSFLRRDPAGEVEPTRATLIEAVAGGWWYAALLGDGRLALVFYSDPDLLPAGATRDAAVLRDLLAGSRFVGRWVAEAGFLVEVPPRLASAGTTWLAPAAGAGWAALGDAAAAFDPLSSHGMTSALWGGVAAAEAAAAALAGDQDAPAAYAARVAAGVEDFLASRREVYGRERRFAAEPFWQRRLAAGAAV